MVNGVLSRKDFVKKITGTTEHLAKLIPQGIFTANHGQESWGLTRRTLNPAFTKASVKDMFPEVVLMPQANGQGQVSIGGKYLIQEGQTTVILTPSLHRDPVTFGPNAEEFKPERMLDHNLKKLPKNAIKPFGNGIRSCIGGEFALQQATVTVALLFQKFDFKFVYPDYEKQYLPSLHRKTKDLKVYATLRPNIDSMTLHRELFSTAR